MTAEIFSYIFQVFFPSKVSELFIEELFLWVLRALLITFMCFADEIIILSPEINI